MIKARREILKKYINIGIRKLATRKCQAIWYVYRLYNVVNATTHRPLISVFLSSQMEMMKNPRPLSSPFLDTYLSDGFSGQPHQHANEH